MLLTIDVGNTNTVLGIFDGSEVVEHWRIATDPVRTADELAVILQGLLGQSALFHEPDITGIALCSTVPSVLHEMREMCSRYYGDVHAVIVEPGVKTGVPVRMDNPKEVGSDRIMNAAAAVHLYGGPAIVVAAKVGATRLIDNMPVMLAPAAGGQGAEGLSRDAARH